MAYLGNVEYEPDSDGIACRVKCPLVDDWIDPIDCMENQTVRDESIPLQFRRKADWKDICTSCPFRDY